MNKREILETDTACGVYPCKADLLIFLVYHHMQIMDGKRWWQGLWSGMDRGSILWTW